MRFSLRVWIPVVLGWLKAKLQTAAPHGREIFRPDLAEINRRAKEEYVMKSSSENPNGKGAEHP